jgi:CubicO group peptidase (beta-lactamase class C family)
MRKLLKRFGIVLLFVLLVANIFIVATGRFYLYKGVFHTYLKGRAGPTPFQYDIFDNREVKNGTPQPWPLGHDYNKKEIDPALLDSMLDVETGALLIIKDDSIRYERYWGEFSDSSITNSFSVAKTVVSILIGCAIDDGYIKSLDQPVSDFIPEFKQDERSKITIRHLVTMSSGLSFDENYANPLSYPAESYFTSDLLGTTMKYNTLNATPGETFRYLSGNSQLLCFVLKNATGKTVSDYASEKLWQPMGCERPAFWSLDAKNGNEKSFCCLNSNARDFARIGKLYLDSGRWNGKQLVPQEYVFASVKPTGLKTLSGERCDFYGYAWWIMKHKGHDIFYARGILGQYVFVIPDENMVVVRLGSDRLPNDSDDIPLDVYYYLNAAFSLYAEK